MAASSKPKPSAAIPSPTSPSSRSTPAPVPNSPTPASAIPTPLDVGDWVLAFGSPFGFEQSMTQGIISAKGRNNVNIIGAHNPALAGLTYENFLQTDAAINPGNSGGPLVNLKGEVVGINTAIASRTGAYNGIGFAIPSNDAKYIMDSLIKSGKIVRGYMGVGIVDVHVPQIRDRVKKEGFTGTSGVLVENVQADSPGGKGGLQVGDIITAINGKPAETMTYLRNPRRPHPPRRQDQPHRLAATVSRSISASPSANNPTLPSPPPPPPDNTVETPADSLGITVKPLDADAARKYGLKTGGVLVGEVGDSGLAAEAGLHVGDVITSIKPPSRRHAGRVHRGAQEGGCDPRRPADGAVGQRLGSAGVPRKAVKTADVPGFFRRRRAGFTVVPSAFLSVLDCLHCRFVA